MKRNPDLALRCGMLAGPLFVLAGLAQAFTRDGFDLREHTLSLLGNGDLGWIQIANFVVTGLLFVICSVGIRTAIPAGRAHTWGPRLIAAFGTGMAAAGVFPPDPAFGFPPGTPNGKPASVSWHGALHYTTASLAFIVLVAACFVFARRYRTLGRPAAAACSALAGVLLIAGVGAVSTGSHSAAGNVTFAVAALLGFLWVSAVAAQLRNECQSTPELRQERRGTWVSQSFTSR
jgi:Protein of unknown function (DUF998)